MDKTILNSLRAAYLQSPGNVPLQVILAKGLLDAGETTEAYKLVSGLKVSQLSTENDKLIVAAIALAAADSQKIFEFLDFENAQSLLMKARAYLLSHDHAAGLETYKKAVSLDPSVEEPELEQSLLSNVADVEMRGKDNIVGFKVISSNEKSLKDEKPAVEGALYAQNAATTTFADVGGLEQVKKAIERKIILPFQKPGIFEKFRRSAGGGVLMYGPPGCGKTLLARATAGECKARFYNVAISDILDMWVGNSEKKLHAIFEQARRTAPSVLFFDELEGLAGKRQQGDTNAGNLKSISQFLSEMDGFAKNNEGVLILGATNVPWSVDPAFRRPGRFDRVLFVPPPDKEARVSILKIHLTERPVEKNIDFNLLAQSTAAFSGADIQNLVETACDLAIEDSLADGAEKPVSMKHLKAALKEVRSTTTEWLSTARNYARYSNEAGQYDEVLDFLKEHGQ